MILFEPKICLLLDRLAVLYGIVLNAYCNRAQIKAEKIKNNELQSKGFKKSTFTVNYQLKKYSCLFKDELTSMGSTSNFPQILK